uniref:G_PROTEIN_RECEP_F1_2 domain-containing protein n=1 Tax=Caenorhabditis tropicalis TaxID=1561998 RepID=A0A1I7V407_9PELO
MSIVLFCGISTFRKLRTLRHTSKRTTTLQQQLFKALVTQTLIPLVTMFVPAAVMMVSPFFELTLGHWEGLIMTVITTYPCVDPMVVIFFVKDYRQAIWQTVRCRRCLFSRETYSVRGTAVSFVTEPL